MENHTCSYQYYNYGNLLGKEKTAQQPIRPVRLLQDPPVKPIVSETTETPKETPKEPDTDIKTKFTGVLSDLYNIFASPEKEPVASVAPVAPVAPEETKPSIESVAPAPPISVASGIGNSHINHTGGGGQFNMNSHSLMRKNRMLHHRVQQLEKELYIVKNKH